MIRVSTKEKFSRYLVYSRHGPDRFTPWLKKIGFDKLPYGLTPIDFVERGWITPTLRVDLPDSYFLSWENYPFCPAEGPELPEGDKWCKACDIIDCYYAVDWLCRLKGENFDTYLKKWRYLDRNQREWAQLEDALRYEYIEEKAHFLQMVPRYLADFDKHISSKQRIRGQQLEDIVEKLWHDQDNFRSFCRAFRQLHNHLSIQGNEEIDFRSFAMLDYFLLLALRAEVLLADILDHAGHDDQSLKLKQIIEKFITVLPQKSIWVKGINSALTNWKELTNLEDKPDDPFNRIQTEMAASCKDGPGREFAIQLLTFGMMRNYFAHHTYFDDRLLVGKTGRSVLVSILVAVIYLTAYKKEE